MQGALAETPDQQQLWSEVRTLESWPGVGELLGAASGELEDKLEGKDAMQG